MKIPTHSKKTSPIQMSKLIYLSSESRSASEDFIPSETESTFTVDFQNPTKNYKSLGLEHIMNIINNHPRLYIGVPSDCYFIVGLVADRLHISLRDILLCLRKIRLNEQFSILGDAFGLPCPTCSTIFF